MRPSSFAVLLAALLVAIALLLGLFLAVLIMGDSRTIPDLLGVRSKHDALKFLGVGIGGVLVALQALMSYKRAKAMETTAAAQAAAAEAQAKASEHHATANENTERGQQIDRLKVAIEHLGNPSVSVRLGGAYELFHLARDAGEFRETALQIICSHIRRTTGEGEYQAGHQASPSEEIQSLLRLVFVEHPTHFRGFRVDLTGSYLRGVDLRCAHLRNARFAKANLEKALLDKAKLENADFFGARLCHASLERACLRNAALVEANLQHCKLIGADLSETRLHGADLRDACLGRAILREAVLEGTKLCKAVLECADMSHANLKETNLSGASCFKLRLLAAKIVGANLAEAKLEKADLRGSELYHSTVAAARLDNANLKGARIWDVNLMCAHLDWADLRGAWMKDVSAQRADFCGAQLQGVQVDLKKAPAECDFSELIGSFAGLDTRLDGVVFRGGLTKKVVAECVDGLSADRAADVRDRLADCVGAPGSNVLPEYYDAATGRYSREEARSWIREYLTASTDPR